MESFSPAAPAGAPEMDEFLSSQSKAFGEGTSREHSGPRHPPQAPRRAPGAGTPPFN